MLWVAWFAVFLIFAGVLIGIALDALSRHVGRWTGLSRGLSLAIVCLVLAGAIAGALFWGGVTLAREAEELGATLMRQLRLLRGELQDIGLEPRSPDGAPVSDEQALAQMLLPDPGQLFGRASTAFGATLGLLGNAAVIALIGVFTAANPDVYRRGVLRLVPPSRRSGAAALLREIAYTLRWWLVGQLATMAIIATIAWIGLSLIGIPGALVLGLQAGLFNFIPYLGPIIAGVPIALSALQIGTGTLLAALGLYAILQTVEGFVLEPLIQRRAVDLPPVLTLAGLVVFGALFGAAGVALATPMLAALRILVLRLYVDRLEGGPAEETAQPKAIAAASVLNGTNRGATGF